MAENGGISWRISCTQWSGCRTPARRHLRIQNVPLPLGSTESPACLGPVCGLVLLHETTFNSAVSMEAWSSPLAQQRVDQAEIFWLLYVGSRGIGRRLQRVCNFLGLMARRMYAWLVSSCTRPLCRRPEQIKTCNCPQMSFPTGQVLSGNACSTADGGFPRHVQHEAIESHHGPRGLGRGRVLAGCARPVRTDYCILGLSLIWSYRHVRSSAHMTT